MVVKVLIACEFSGVVRDAFSILGHDAMSCDLLPTESPGPHYQGDVFDLNLSDFDLLIAHPPCTYLTCTGNKWMKPEFSDRFPDRPQQRKDAAEFFMRLYNAPIERVAIENPVGVMSSIFRKPDQYVHPYFFGNKDSKKTGLWLRGLPPLVPTKMVEPEMYVYPNGKKDPMWHIKTATLPAKERQRVRSKTHQGIAWAMALQWGSE